MEDIRNTIKRLAEFDLMTSRDQRLRFLLAIAILSLLGWIAGDSFNIGTFRGGIQLLLTLAVFAGLLVPICSE